MTVFTAPTLSVFSATEQATVDRLLAQLATCTPKNLEKQRYYEGTARVRDLGISIPPSLLTVNTVVGWPTTTVDVLDERLNLQGFGQATEADDAGLAPILSANHLLAEAPQGHLDALIFGTAFMAVGTGYDGEPDPLVTYESPLNTTGIYNRRSRRLSSALTQDYDPITRQATRISLYLPNQTITASLASNRWKVDNRDEHGVGRPLVVRLVNRPRTSNPYGRSEISRAVRSYTDNAVRTLLGMEVAREFYSAPQRYLLGAPESAFQGPDGKPKAAWESYLGRYLALDPGENDDGTQRKVEVGQFDAASPAPYGDQIRLLSELLAAESGFPSSYLGFATDNPPSADAIRALEARLVKRAERRTVSFGAGEVEAIELACRIRDGVWPKPGIHAQYADPATPTQASTADAITKQIAAGIISPTSDVTLQRLGYSPDERLRLRTGQ